MRKISEIVAKAFMVVACAIILMHAVVPHHHHDCCGEVGIVYEDEVCCHCDTEQPKTDACCSHAQTEAQQGHTHSHHPIDLCKLQDLLSHLVLSTKEDETYHALVTVAEHDLYAALLPEPIDTEISLLQITVGRCVKYDETLPSNPVPASSPLRAPPQA